MKTIGIKLADGSFYPILKEGTAKTCQLDLTTVKDGQTKVQIDLYRSETGSMEDAEYVDTLEVSNLVPHPNGEADLHLSVGLNENNELDAKVVDEETGKQSETSVTLVSRTLAERSEPTNFELSDTSEQEEENNHGAELAAAAAGGAALGAAAASELSKDSGENKDQEVVEETVEEVPFSFDSEIEKEKEQNEELSQLENAVDVAEVEENTADDEPQAEGFKAEVDELPDLDDDFFSTDSAEADSGKADPSESVEDKTAADSSTDEAKSDDFSLPDFDEPIASDAGTGSSSSSSVETEGLTGYFDDPDFKNDPVFNDTGIDSSDTNEIDFDTSSLDVPSDTGADTSSNPAMDFSDLYDKETLEGKNSSYNEEEDEETKTHVPMIICIICAIICIIATVLVLFVVPSKYNLIKSRNTRNQSVEKVIEPPAAEQKEELAEIEPEEEFAEDALPQEAEPQEDEAPQAVEDQIVIAPEPEKVVPVPPPEPEKAKDIKYHIKWGDTLWDIADAYYKNPWRYPKIAKYNKIKNPDLIISGTDILIPIE